MDTNRALRGHVLALLDGRLAHMNFDDVLFNFPVAQINAHPPNVPYTFWHLIEHIRITQWDILEYTRDAKHVSPQWPEGYWPSPADKAEPAQWAETVRRFYNDLQAMKDMVANPNTDLFAPIPHGYGGHTILREALLIADHNAYHIGELGILRQVMRIWPK